VVIAHGTPKQVLSNPIVARAYLGEEIEDEVGIDVEGALQ
jgi:ABC-type lipopolysaccharide export system ATPase subunit